MNNKPTDDTGDFRLVIETPTLPSPGQHTPGYVALVEGMDAGRAASGPASCPYPSGVLRKIWFIGYGAIQSAEEEL